MVRDDQNAYLLNTLEISIFRYYSNTWIHSTNDIHRAMSYANHPPHQYASSPLNQPLIILTTV